MQSDDWISISDRLPESGTDVLVTIQRKHFKNKILVAYFTDIDHDTDRRSPEAARFLIDRFCEDKVSHWMPLPEPAAKGEGWFAPAAKRIQRKVLPFNRKRKLPPHGRFLALCEDGAIRVAVRLPNSADGASQFTVKDAPSQEGASEIIGWFAWSPEAETAFVGKQQLRDWFFTSSSRYLATSPRYIYAPKDHQETPTR